MSPIPLNDMMDEWTPEQLLAVYDFSRLLSDTLWYRYQDELVKQLLEDARGDEIATPHREHLERQGPQDRGVASMYKPPF